MGRIGTGLWNGATRYSRVVMAQRSKLIDELFIEALMRGESIEEICKNDWAPSEMTFYRWQRDDPALAAMVARARADGVDRQLMRAEKMFWDLGKDGKPVTYNDIQRVKALHDAIKWRAARVIRAYNDRLIVDQTTRTIEPDSVVAGEAADAYVDAMRGRVTLQ